MPNRWHVVSGLPSTRGEDHLHFWMILLDDVSEDFWMVFGRLFVMWINTV